MAGKKPTQGLARSLHSFTINLSFRSFVLIGVRFDSHTAGLFRVSVLRPQFRNTSDDSRFFYSVVVLIPIVSAPCTKSADPSSFSFPPPPRTNSVT